MKRAIILCLALGACGTVAKAPPGPSIVSVGVPVTCVPDSLAPAPALPFSREQLKAADGPDRHRMMGADLIVLLQRYAETEPVIAGCRADAPPH